MYYDAYMGIFDCVYKKYPVTSPSSPESLFLLFLRLVIRSILSKPFKNPIQIIKVKVETLLFDS